MAALTRGFPKAEMMTKSIHHGIEAGSPTDALGLAAAAGLLGEMGLLIADGVDLDAIAPSTGNTALIQASIAGMLPSVDFLIKAGADLDRTSRAGLTALMAACTPGKRKGGDPALRLIEAGADVRHVRPRDGMTALKLAAQVCSRAVILALIEHGAEVDGPTDTDETALMIAARSDNVGALEVLVAHGAEIMRPSLKPRAGGRSAEGLATLEGSPGAVEFFRKLGGG